jgi:acetolactate synthase I/III small subunit
MASLRTLVAYVEDKPGVLNRVASLFRRRSYNIASLTVGRTHEIGVSRMTIVVEGDSRVAQLMEANLYKLVNVLSVQDITDTPAVVRDMALIKIAVESQKRAEVLQLIEVFHARVVDICSATLMAEITGSPDKIDAFVEVIQPFGISEMVQTGRISMTRGVEGEASRISHGQGSDSVVTAA